jgi:hypothetical protein
MTAGRKLSKLVMLVLVLIASHSNLIARERATNFGVWDIGFSVTGGFIDQSYNPDGGTRLRMPAYMKSERYDAPMAAYYSALKTDDLTDNPLLHGAMYSHMALDARSAGLRLSCKLIAEHRGTSFGTYATKNVVVMPTFLVSVDTSFVIGGETFQADIEGGNFDDYKLFEGLTIYNMDVQGYHIHLKWRLLKLSVDHISDLGVGIGLGIDDEADYAVSAEDVSLGGRLKLDASAGYFEYLGSSDAVSGLRRNGMNVSAALRWSDWIRFYTQVGIRGADDPSLGGLERCADLIGLAYRDELKEKLDLGLTAEYRYYGRYFNKGHTYDGTCFLYRGFDGYGSECSSWNTVGAHLYPLHVFFRPFSQWAVYADYEGRDVQSLIFRADASYKLPGNCTLACNLDFNYLDVSNEDPFLYPFYDLGFAWAPAPGTTISISHTNRAMNLDKHYPTLYLTQRGTIMVAVRSAISF